jgi:ribosomal protein S18 acetylase RimI-like enzyme
VGADRPPPLSGPTETPAEGPVNLRRLVDADVEAVADLLGAVVAEGRWLGQEPPFDRDEAVARLRADLAGAGRDHLVAVVDGEVAGHLGMEVAPYGVASLSMFVAPDRRRRGVGAALVEAAVADAVERGAHKVTLQVWPHNAAARALYRRFGFVDEGRLRRHYRRRNGELWDAVVMGLVLDRESPGGPPTDGSRTGH